jgi:hypothetical protein
MGNWESPAGLNKVITVDPIRLGQGTEIHHPNCAPPMPVTRSIHGR